jgi:serine/threonine protein kinase
MCHLPSISMHPASHAAQVLPVCSTSRWSFKNEYSCYRALGLGQGHDWMPKAFQAGLYRTSKGVVPWITMELLGPSLHSLMRHPNIIGPSNLGAYAHGMLTALENLHRAGYVHRDVKPEVRHRHLVPFLHGLLGMRGQCSAVTNTVLASYPLLQFCLLPHA